MDTKSQRILNIYETGVSETELTETLKTKINASTGGSLGSIKPTDAAPTPARNGNYTFSIGGNKPAWLTAEAGVTTVKAGDGVSVVYDGVSAYTYTHVDTGSIALTRGWWLKNPYQNKINGFDAVVSSVIDVSLVGCDATKNYSIASLCKNHPTYKNMLIIFENNVQIAISELADIDAIGIKRVSVASGDKKIYLTINYDLLDDGFIFNAPTANDCIHISERCHINPEIALKSKTYNINQTLDMFDFQNKNYLVDIKKVIDATQTVNRAAFAGILDIWFENLSTSIYSNYEFTLVYVGRNDPTFKDILWIGRRASSAAPWEYKTASSGTTTYFTLNDYIIKKSVIWDGVTINIVVTPHLLPTVYKDVTGVLLKKTEFPNNDISKTIDYFIQKTSINTANIAKVTPYYPTKKGVVLSGSSITWGEGFLDSSFVTAVDDYLKTKLATVVLPSSMTFSEVPVSFNNVKQYKGIGSKLTGLNKKINFNISGDELVLCHTTLRTTDWAKMQVKANGVIIGSFTNHNSTLGTQTDVFTANGVDLKFALSKACTYNHVITVDGVNKIVAINTGGYGSTFPAGVDVLIIRKLDANGEPIHVAWFKVAPANSAAISVSYSYGQIITHERSLLGQTTSDAINESTYGDGNTSFDPANPSSLSSGMEFRAIDERALFVYKFTSVAERTIEIEIISGTNPYFIINYASNRHHNLMNAGIGGWTTGALINNDRVNDYGNFYKYFMPDVIIQESGTNDDWAYASRRLTRTVTGLTEAQVKNLCTLELKRIALNGGTFDVDFTTGLISSITPFSLVCPQIVGSAVAVGDIVRIGNYHGDNKQIVCRSIETVNLATGEITWLEPVNHELILNIAALSELVGCEVSIRDLSGYQANCETLIQKIQKASPQTKIVFAQPGLSNYFQRQLWGYQIIHRRLAQKFVNISVIEVTEWIYDFQKGNISGANFLNVNATGATSYDLAWTGHWQGFKVIVGGEDVYGKDCYIQSGSFYSVPQLGTGADLNITTGYERANTATKAMKLVFTKNIPASGTIRIERADSVWSSDFCHPVTDGNFIYSQAYISCLNNLIG